MDEEKCYWKVRSWDKNGNVGRWSEIAKWEIGLLSKADWKASWIGNNLTAFGKGIVYHLPPSPYFRKEKNLESTVKCACLWETL